MDNPNAKDISYDLQITLIGHQVVQELFRTISRNLTERWAIRYEHLQVRVLANQAGFSKSLQTAVQAVQARPERRQANIFATYVPGHHKNKDADYLKIASYLRGARKNMFIWAIPTAWFTEKESLINHPINQQLISLGQVLQAMEREPGMDCPALHVMELENRKTSFRLNSKKYEEARPWASLPPQNDPDTEETIRERIPQLYEIMRSTATDLRFHTLPRSKRGSHLDYAPRWIDLFIYDALGWNSNHIIEWNENKI